MPLAVIPSYELSGHHTSDGDLRREEAAAEVAAEVVEAVEVRLAIHPALRVAR